MATIVSDPLFAWTTVGMKSGISVEAIDGRALSDYAASWVTSWQKDMSAPAVPQ